jgi:hypothetical protein
VDDLSPLAPLQFPGIESQYRRRDPAARYPPADCVHTRLRTACRAGLLEKCLFILPPESDESRKEHIAALADCTAPATDTETGTDTK